MANAYDKTSRTDATGRSHVTTGYHLQTISELMLDNSMSDVDKLGEILRKSNKNNVYYEVTKVINSAHGKVYIVQASNNEINATGRGTTLNSAKTNAAFSLLSQIYDKVNVCTPRSSTSNQNWSSSIVDDDYETVFDNNCKNVNMSTQSQAQTMFYSPISEVNDDIETIFDNNCKIVNMSTQSQAQTMFYSLISEVDDDNETVFDNNCKIVNMSTQNQAKTMFYSPISEVDDDNETIFDNNCKNINVSTQTMFYSPISELQKDQKTCFHNNSTSFITATSNILCHSHEPKVENSAEENYVGLLQEFCMSYNLSFPQYIFSQEINEESVIIFTVTCSLLTFETMGKEKSKRLAKRSAACEMYVKIKKLSKTEIDSLCQKSSHYSPISEVQKDQKTCFHNNSTSAITASSNICYSYEPKVENSTEENYVNLLQEFCMSFNLSFPQYIFSQEINEESVIIFTARCSLLTFETMGKGKSKRLAKRSAACEMYLKIKKLSKTEIPSLCQKVSKYQLSLKPSNKPSSVLLSSKSMDSLLIFMKELKLPALNGVVDFLDSIAQEEGFSIIYIDCVNNTGISVMAQLLADSVILYYGSGTGNTFIEAQRSAAYSILVYLQINSENFLLNK